jgi:dTDP-glucose pyrophosphorylase
MNVLVLMAGKDDAFREAGYQYPKNLIEIDGLPLIERVLGGLSSLLAEGARLVVCVRGEENRRHHTATVVRLLVPAAEVVEIQGPTAGAACTALLAVDHIDNDEPLLIVNGDQILNADVGAIIRGFRDRRLDGGIIVFEAVHPRWSYVRLGAGGYVVEAAEKRPISNLATAGAYYFARGRDFVRSATESIKKDAHVNGVFYVCPTYNEMILTQARVGVHSIARDAYISLATPDGVRAYEARLQTGAH